MLNHQTIEGLYALKLPAMATGLAEQAESANHQALSFEERLGLLVDRELAERESRRLERYLKSAKLRTNAVVEDIDFRSQRGLDRHRGDMGISLQFRLGQRSAVHFVGAVGEPERAQ